MDSLHACSQLIDRVLFVPNSIYMLCVCVFFLCMLGWGWDGGVHVCVTVLVVGGATGWGCFLYQGTFCVLSVSFYSVYIGVYMGGFLWGGGGAITVYVCGQPIYTVFVCVCVCDSMLYVLCLVYVLLSVLFVVLGIISPLYGRFVTCVSSWYSVCPVCECFAVYVTLGSTLFDGSATSSRVLSGLILWREDFAMLISCILLLNCIVPQILSHTGLIDSNSEVEAYLHKVLKDGVAGNNARNEEMSENARVGLSSHRLVRSIWARDSLAH